MPTHKIQLELAEIDRKNYHIFLNVSVGKKHCRLLLDTGASKTVLDAKRVLQFVKPAHILKHESKSVGLGTADMETSTAKLRNVQMGQVRFASLSIAVLPLGHVNEAYQMIGLPFIDGVLGSDFLVKYKCVIDFEKVVLKLKK